MPVQSLGHEATVSILKGIDLRKPPGYQQVGEIIAGIGLSYLVWLVALSFELIPFGRRSEI